MRVPHIQIVTEDGKIAPLTSVDAQDLVAITDESVTEKISFLPSIFQAEQADALILSQGWLDRFHGLRCQQTGRLIGVIGVHARGGMDVEIGYWFDKQVRGKGIAARNVQRVVQQVASQCAGCVILAECAPSNVKSWALLQRIGFSPLGVNGKRAGRRLLRWYAKAGERIDVC